MFNLFLSLTSFLRYGTSDFREEISLEELEAPPLPNPALPPSRGGWNAGIPEPVPAQHEAQRQASLQEQRPSSSSCCLPRDNWWTLYTGRTHWSAEEPEMSVVL